MVDYLAHVTTLWDSRRDQKMEKSKVRGEEKKDSSKRPAPEDECEVGEIIKDLADVQVGMRLEAMDKFGKWYDRRQHIPV